MGRDRTLEKVVDGMGDNTLDPYSAAEAVIARMQGGAAGR